MSLFSLALPAIGAVMGYGQMSSARKASNRASDIAEGMSQEQRALLSEMLKNLKQYGPGLLSSAWERTQGGETAAQRGQAARLRSSIEAGYRPAFAEELSSLSGRNLLSTPNTYAGPRIHAMDLARGRDVGGAMMGWQQYLDQQRGTELSRFSDILGRLTGQSTQAAGAFEGPIGTFGDLASSGASGQYDWLNALIMLMSRMKEGKGGGSTIGSTGPGVTNVGGKSYLNK